MQRSIGPYLGHRTLSGSFAGELSLIVYKHAHHEERVYMRFLFDWFLLLRLCFFFVLCCLTTNFEHTFRFSILGYKKKEKWTDYTSRLGATTAAGRNSQSVSVWVIIPFALQSSHKGTYRYTNRAYRRRPGLGNKTWTRLPSFRESQHSRQLSYGFLLPTGNDHLWDDTFSHFGQFLPVFLLKKENTKRRWHRVKAESWAVLYHSAMCVE